MQTDVFFKIRRSAVIHEFLENEVIIADLDTGTYYSLRNVAVTVWQLLLAGYSLAQVSEKIANHCALAVEEIVHDINAFVNQLLAEEILVQTNVAQDVLANTAIMWPVAYGAPAVDKYTDMQELLMLDPIHEVDEQGWPSQKTVEV